MTAVPAMNQATGAGHARARLLRVAIAGFGSIGRLVGRHLDEGIAGLRLVSVSAANLERARANLKGFRTRVDAVALRTHCGRRRRGGRLRPSRGLP